MEEKNKMDKKIIGRQLLSVTHHNKCLYDNNWFKTGHIILVVERLFYDDGTTKKKFNATMNPTVRFHGTLDKPLERPVLFVDKKDTEEYEADYNNLYYQLADLTNQMNYYKETNGPGANQRRRLLHLHPDLHGSDINIADHYIDRYIETVTI